jgi:hypothetical protein
MADEQVPARLELGITERGDFTYTFDGVRYGGDGDGSEEEPEGDGPEAAIAEDLVPDGEADAAVSPSAGDGEVGEAGEPERPEAPAE